MVCHKYFQIRVQQLQSSLDLGKSNLFLKYANNTPRGQCVLLENSSLGHFPFYLDDFIDDDFIQPENHIFGKLMTIVDPVSSVKLM